MAAVQATILMSRINEEISNKLTSWLIDWLGSLINDDDAATTPSKLYFTNVRYTNGSKDVLMLNMRWQHLIPNGNTRKLAVVVHVP